MRTLLDGGMRDALTRYSDIGLAALVIGIIGMMIIPLPTFLLDLLLTLNITISVSLLMVSLYIPSALHISAFPSILLITTLFRLALNVSSTRLILLQADAGEVIASFGNFVVQGNYVVGAVIFMILTLIQFLVIAKGAERVSEVGARFTLDAMPGKQMAIDADLRAGIIDQDQARKRREMVQMESRLYGAMDGAMKFVKGDAIAGVIMTAINIIAGIIIGVMQRDMGAADAAQTYTLLTIGDGLVSQIPALLIATTAGIIVTRVATEDEGEAAHLGADVFGQLLAHPKALAITSVLLFALGVIPGLPTVPFFAIGGLLAVVSYGLFQANQSSDLSEEEEAALAEVEGAAKQGARQARALMPAVTPLAVDIGVELSSELEGGGREWLEENLPALREGFFFEHGIKIPAVRLRSNSRACGPRECRVCIDEIPVMTFSIPEGVVLVNEAPEELELFNVQAVPTVHPATGLAASWVRDEEWGILEESGSYKSWGIEQYVLLQLVTTLAENAADFVRMQDVQLMLEQLEGPYPAIVQEVVPKLLTLQALTEILHRLASEGISLRNLPRILEVLSVEAQTLSEPVELTEAVRAGLSRYITHKYSEANQSLVVYLVDREIENMVADSIRPAAAGAYIALTPQAIREIIDAVRLEVAPDLEAGRAPILLTDQRARPYLRRIVSTDIPDIVVLAYQEVDPALRVEPLGRVMI